MTIKTENTIYCDWCTASQPIGIYPDAPPNWRAYQLIALAGPGGHDCQVALFHLCCDCSVKVSDKGNGFFNIFRPSYKNA